MDKAKPDSPDALLLLTSRCSHCPAVLQALADLVKKGLVGRLEVVNIEQRPAVAEQLGVRSVPWVKLGEFELEGLHSQAELEQWAGRAVTETGLADYYADLLKQGQLAKALNALRKKPQQLACLLPLAENPDTELTVRIGVSAVLEDFQGTEPLQQQLPAFIELGRHPDPRVRADACHFMTLTRSGEALAPLESLVNDPERAVQDVARDALKELREQLDG